MFNRNMVKCWGKINDEGDCIQWNIWCKTECVVYLYFTPWKIHLPPYQTFSNLEDDINMLSCLRKCSLVYFKPIRFLWILNGKRALLLKNYPWLNNGITLVQLVVPVLWDCVASLILLDNMQMQMSFWTFAVCFNLVCRSTNLIAQALSKVFSHWNNISSKNVKKFARVQFKTFLTLVKYFKSCPLFI